MVLKRPAGGSAGAAMKKPASTGYESPEEADDEVQDEDLAIRDRVKSVKFHAMWDALPDFVRNEYNRVSYVVTNTSVEF